MRLGFRLGWAALACALLVGSGARGESAAKQSSTTKKTTSTKKAISTKKTTTSTKKATTSTRSRKKSHQSSKPPEFPPDADTSWASTVARMDHDACHAELQKRGIRVAVPSGPNEDTRGVAIPVRLLGPLGGVSIRSDYPDAQRPTLPFEVFDCRLVLAVSAFTSILREHDVTEVRIFSAYRPPSKRTPESALLTGHPGGLAVDLRLFMKEDGAHLDVLRDFHGQVGAVPCGPNGSNGTEKLTGAAKDLRGIFCEGARARLFHLMLSPDFDRPHRNHFHVEVRPSVPWFIVR